MGAVDVNSPNDLAGSDPVSDLDTGVVAWDDQHDTQNPRNFPSTRKSTILALLSCMIVLSFLTSSVIAPAASSIDSEFHNDSSTVSSMVTTIYVFGYLSFLKVGPLLLSPLSEFYGRRPVFYYANIFYTLTHVGSALSPNIGCLLAFRTISGFGASACFSVAGGMLADLYDVHQRGVPNAVITTGSLFGPVLGPLFGGIITQRAGWRWIFWTLLIASAIVTVLMNLFTPETNAHIILRRKALRIGKETGRTDLLSFYDNQVGTSSKKNPQTLGQALRRPWKMLFRSPLVPVFCIMTGFISALLYILLTSTSSFFQEVYGWPLETAGLAYLGLGFGSLIGLLLFARTSDLIAARLAKKNGGLYQPEMRLVTAFIPALFIPVTFFWYGWSTYSRTHWIVPLISLAPFGFAQVGINASSQAYLIDASGPYASSSYACVVSARCLIGGFLPLVGPSLYRNLGLGWGNSVLGFVSLAMVPIPLLLYRYGQRLRERSPLDTV
ncbi:major facilitator superfamily transporter [Colletotrichum paranaense]|uniref:Major facilitator superfamily transporter n=1 Tax=Colletotrichum paranaense TaxID=1914294 RepID=A0ABQ9SZ71_9PEZI|nr:major facilitator superfamily transporter [Colletotrichum paranaense]KAK1544826.1 major facilitator superfamily transporter [Colletotrichum paranaense]